MCGRAKRPDRTNVPAESLRGQMRGHRRRFVRSRHQLRRLRIGARLRRKPVRGCRERSERRGHHRQRRWTVRGPDVHARSADDSLWDGDQRLRRNESVHVPYRPELPRGDLWKRSSGVYQRSGRVALRHGIERLRQRESGVRQLQRLDRLRRTHLHVVHGAGLREREVRLGQQRMRPGRHVRELRGDRGVLRRDLLHPADLCGGSRRRDGHRVRSDGPRLRRHEELLSVPGRPGVHEQQVRRLRSEDMCRFRRRGLRPIERVRQHARLLQRRHDLPGGHLLRARPGLLQRELLRTLVRSCATRREPDQLRSGDLLHWRFGRRRGPALKARRRMHPGATINDT